MIIIKRTAVLSPVFSHKLRRNYFNILGNDENDAGLCRHVVGLIIEPVRCKKDECLRAMSPHYLSTEC